MPPSSGQLRRYASIVRVLLRNRDAVRLVTGGVVGAVDDEMTKEGEQLADDLESLGPTFVKLGQLLSTRSDLLPPPYLKALSRLQDHVTPFPGEESRRVFKEEIGVDPSDAFGEFEDVPFASASLGQVHRARLRDGRPVVVKVQRPGMDAQIATDLDALGQVAELLDAHTDAGRRFGFQDLLDQFRRSLGDELDYRHEARNLLRLGEIVHDRGIIVPAPVDDFSSKRVLTMDEIEGRKVSDLSRLAGLELDGAELAETIIVAYLDQIFVYGFFHADPHPGNVLVTPERHLALIDLGMVGQIRSEIRTQLVRLLLAVEEGQGQEAGEVLVRLGRPLEEFDETKVLREVADVVARRSGLALAEFGAGALITELSEICGAAGLRPPPELSLLARALLNLESVTRHLDPTFDPQESMRRHSAEIARKEMQANRGLLSALVEARDFAEQLPGRVNRVMGALARGELTLRVHAFDEAEMLRSLTKIANRLAIGLVIAALFLGSALVAKSHPMIALVCFVVAIVLGLSLIASMAFVDRDLKRRLKRRKGL